MDILFFQPGFPDEIPYFVRGLAEMGVRVWGVGDQPTYALPEIAKKALTGYLPVRNLWNADSLFKELVKWRGFRGFDRIESLWEPGMLIAAQLREKFGLPGMKVKETLLFRDKGLMKKKLLEGGVRVPKFGRAKSIKEVYSLVEKIGFPIIVKPIAGAGSQDTYKVTDKKELDSILPLLRHIEEVSVEEYIEGEEYTFDTISADGQILYYNVSWYRPKPLVARSYQWISPQTYALQNLTPSHIQAGIELGKKVLKVLGFRTGFTHMEWFSTPTGEAVFGEIAARPPGARSVELMNYSCDIDVFRGWAEATCFKRLTQQIIRKYNAGIVFKRAKGEGIIRKIEGVEQVLGRYRRWITCINLLPVGARRRNWRQTLISDGYIIFRHPDLNRAIEIGDFIGATVQLYAA